jgi:uncharacterized protein (DUF4415 family)
MKTKNVKTVHRSTESIDGLIVSGSMSEAEKHALRHHTNENDLILDEASHLDPQQVKARLSMFIDQDLLDEIRRQAQTKGAKYQTFLNATLRDLFLHPKEGSKENHTVASLSKALLILTKTNATQAATIAHLEQKLLSLVSTKKRA